MLFALVASLAATSAAAASPGSFDSATGRRPEHTRLVFDLSGAAPPATRFRMVDSTTFEVYLPKVRKSPAVTTEFVGDSLVADIFPAVSDSGTSVRIRLKRKVTPLGFVLAASDEVPDQVVVDVPMPANPAAEQALQQKVTEMKSSKSSSWRSTRGTAARTRGRSGTGARTRPTSHWRCPESSKPSST